ncbi:Dipeptide transport system permease protein DppB [bioreactor metagenome]|uniref:Dipeptide transport system permease protein DppB n=1 Tax=bioreactor metagenome TaxID=1076179 RepID=A0A644YVK7_9ZZZZ
MVRYVVKRLAAAIPIFIGITIIVYTLVSIAPGGPLDIINSAGSLSAEDLQQLKVSMGLDKPILVRYLIWLRDLVTGDLGVSYRTNQSVATMISLRIVPSLILTLTGTTLAILIGVPLGVLSAYRPYSPIDTLSSGLAFIGTSAPGFFISLVSVYIFAAKLKILPAQGMYSTETGKSLSSLLLHLLLPACVVALQSVGGYIKQTRGSVLEVLNEDYIKTARSKGLRETAIVIRHALRNALIPIVTLIGLSVPYMIGGAVVTEQIFSWPGIGSLMILSINNRDYPVIMGITVLISVTVLSANILLDLIYASLDPRISYQ